ncbi:MAG: hypothetical protein A2Z43_00025 [Syntrophobacterales bacterium RBG_19FT_COMBO_59_10]|nr:MAG: hypothetical protein A2Z43_00025 [Syntrophobacterales bacterium RBG_19FT_COMBO_59_10]
MAELYFKTWCLFEGQIRCVVIGRVRCRYSVPEQQRSAEIEALLMDKIERWKALEAKSRAAAS